MTTSNKKGREARQERARAMREAQQAASRRRRRLFVSLGVVGVLIIVVVVAIVASSSSNGNKGPIALPKDAVTTGPKVAQGSMLIGTSTAPVTMDAYEDFNCPFCGELERSTGSTVTKLINDGTLQVRYHIMSFIDGHNGGTYSHRAANAFAAANTYGDQAKALQLHALLYANQPEESSKAGLTDEQILSYAKQAGLDSPQFVNAVQTMEFKDWVSKVADDASKAGVTSTPTLYLNGKQVDTSKLVDSTGQGFSAEKLEQAVNAAKSS
jgi:protein-disulfide isomerase